MLLADEDRAVENVQSRELLPRRARRLRGANEALLPPRAPHRQNVQTRGRWTSALALLMQIAKAGSAGATAAAMHVAPRR